MTIFSNQVNSSLTFMTGNKIAADKVHIGYKMSIQGVPDSIQRFLKRLCAEYKETLSVPQNCNYLYGNPINPVVPLDVAQDGVFIIGAYPTAKVRCPSTVSGMCRSGILTALSPMNSISTGHVSVPVKSGQELEQAYLGPLGLHREQCWQPAVLNIV